MSIISFISASTAAIFSADEGWGRPNPRKDMMNDASVVWWVTDVGWGCGQGVWCFGRLNSEDENRVGALPGQKMNWRSRPSDVVPAGSTGRDVGP